MVTLQIDYPEFQAKHRLDHDEAEDIVRLHERGPAVGPYLPGSLVYYGRTARNAGPHKDFIGRQGPGSRS